MDYNKKKDFFKNKVNSDKEEDFSQEQTIIEEKKIVEEVKEQKEEIKEKTIMTDLGPVILAQDKALKKEEFLEMQIFTEKRNTLAVKKELAKLKVEFNNLQKELTSIKNNNEVGFIQSQSIELDRNYNNFLKKVEDRLGYSIKNKSIDPETLEVI